jgi:Ca2+/Na+ antiporter
MRKKHIVRNGLLYLSVIIAAVLFVLASFKLSILNTREMLVMLLSGGYILLFCHVNEVEL